MRSTLPFSSQDGLITLNEQDLILSPPPAVQKHIDYLHNHLPGDHSLVGGKVLQMVRDFLEYELSRNHQPQRLAHPMYEPASDIDVVSLEVSAESLADLPQFRLSPHKPRLYTVRTDGPIHIDLSLPTIWGENWLEEDVKGRDFPICALYYNCKTKRLIDPTGRGISDLLANRLSMIGNPEERFAQCPERIIRALKYILQGMVADPATAKALRSWQPNLDTMDLTTLYLAFNKERNFLYNKAEGQLLADTAKYFRSFVKLCIEFGLIEKLFGFVPDPNNLDHTITRLTEKLPALLPPNARPPKWLVAPDITAANFSIAKENLKPVTNAKIASLLRAKAEADYLRYCQERHAAMMQPQLATPMPIPFPYVAATAYPPYPAPAVLMPQPGWSLHSMPMYVPPPAMPWPSPPLVVHPATPTFYPAPVANIPSEAPAPNAPSAQPELSAAPQTQQVPDETELATPADSNPIVVQNREQIRLARKARKATQKAERLLQKQQQQAAQSQAELEEVALSAPAEGAILSAEPTPADDNTVVPTPESKLELNIPENSTQAKNKKAKKNKAKNKNKKNKANKKPEAKDTEWLRELEELPPDKHVLPAAPKVKAVNKLEVRAFPQPCHGEYKYFLILWMDKGEEATTKLQALLNIIYHVTEETSLITAIKENVGHLFSGKPYKEAWYEFCKVFSSSEEGKQDSVKDLIFTCGSEIMFGIGTNHPERILSYLLSDAVLAPLQLTYNKSVLAPLNLAKFLIYAQTICGLDANYLLHAGKDMDVTLKSSIEQGIAHLLSVIASIIKKNDLCHGAVDMTNPERFRRIVTSWKKWFQEEKTRHLTEQNNPQHNTNLPQIPSSQSMEINTQAASLLHADMACCKGPYPIGIFYRLDNNPCAAQLLQRFTICTRALVERGLFSVLTLNEEMRKADLNEIQEAVETLFKNLTKDKPYFMNEPVQIDDKQYGVILTKYPDYILTYFFNDTALDMYGFQRTQTLLTPVEKRKVLKALDIPNVQLDKHKVVLNTFKQPAYIDECIKFIVNYLTLVLVEHWNRRDSHASDIEALSPEAIVNFCQAAKAKASAEEAADKQVTVREKSLYEANSSTFFASTAQQNPARPADANATKPRQTRKKC